MKLNVIMPEVASCAMTACGYNQDRNCHARAITVGDGTHPMCDTYAPVSGSGAGTSKAGVGACKVTVCTYNRDLECEAEGIRVDLHDGHPDCVTFAPRP